MTTEREMLEFVAKACGIDIECWHDGWNGYEKSDGDLWNPLTNSADCAAMCAKLEIDTTWEEASIFCAVPMFIHATWFEDHNNDREAAWRCAATQVAAKIGGMK